ncbi:hypothetical protein [Arthrobacter sp. MMS18-M83]|nr:hypothetical protein [Arthrobacter sp. MMS18-M83]WAH99719.1 hypothetical protein OW521_19870 [Arthrobacter sp. MMS18-M83]
MNVLIKLLGMAVGMGAGFAANKALGGSLEQVHRQARPQGCD